MILALARDLEAIEERVLHAAKPGDLGQFELVRPAVFVTEEVGTVERDLRPGSGRGYRKDDAR